METAEKLSIGKRIGMELLKDLAHDYGRDVFNFQNILDECNKDNFNTDQEDSAITHKDNMKKNCVKSDVADRLRKAFRDR